MPTYKGPLLIFTYNIYSIDKQVIRYVIINTFNNKQLEKRKNPEIKMHSIRNDICYIDHMQNVDVPVSSSYISK